MSENVSIEPMTEDFILWRCLHSGPLSKDTIEHWPKDAEQNINFRKIRAVNIPLLKKLIKTYDTCAIIARQGDEIIGMLRFYPKAVISLNKAGYLCLQQDYPPGPAPDLISEKFPSFDQIEDKTLKIHCIMTSRPFAGDKETEIFGMRCLDKVEAGARKGIGLKLARALVDWARKQGWKRIELTTFADLDIFYGTSGGAGKGFWEKAGFKVEKTRPMSRDGWPDEKAKTLIDAQAKAAGITNDQAWSFYDMTCEL
jgi:ribosomal protein S18 acetylase RimI-like enzyme